MLIKRAVVGRALTTNTVLNIVLYFHSDAIAVLRFSHDEASRGVIGALWRSAGYPLPFYDCHTLKSCSTNDCCIFILLSFLL